MEFVSQENVKTVEKLNQQLDYINKENHELRAQVKDLDQKAHHSSGFFKENDKLFDRISQLENEKGRALLQLEDT